MIRFIDIRNQGTGYRFAFFNTSTDAFVNIDRQEVFDRFDEIYDWEPDTLGGKELRRRLISLCPEWTKDGEEDDLSKWWEN